MELLITVTIIGVLMSVALPAYNRNMKSGRRAQAQATMFSASQFLQRYYLARGTYNAATLPTAYQASDGYTIALSIGTDNQSYTLTATPTATDVDCGNLTLRDTGAKGVSGTASVASCW